jgi:hypothetical protein
MIRHSVVSFALLMAFACQPAALATNANGLFWYFQKTGFSATNGSQTAVAMGDAKSWPVVFSDDGSSTRAITLRPVINGTTGTYWHQVGSSMLGATYGRLSAKSSVDGRVGVSRNMGGVGVGAAGVGRRTGPFAETSGVADVAFDSSGAAVMASSATLNGSQITNPASVLSLAVSPFGDRGFLVGDSNSWYSNSVLSYHEQSPTLGWQSTTVRTGTGGYLIGGDLAIDAIGRPFVAYGIQSMPGSSFSVAASYFDIMSGQWRQQTLASGLNSSVLPTIAADGVGGVGLAWMSDVSGANSLMYAYKKGSADWTVHTVTSLTVTSGLFTSSLISQPRVGLDFDAENYPVISFMGGGNEIWLAYDPIVVPEPSSLVLAGLGLLASTIAMRRTRR